MLQGMSLAILILRREAVPAIQRPSTDPSTRRNHQLPRGGLRTARRLAPFHALEYNHRYGA